MGTLSAAELAQVFSNLAGVTAGSPMTQQRAMAANQATQANLAREYQEQLEEEQDKAAKSGMLGSIGGTLGAIGGTLAMPIVGTAIGAGLGSAAGSAMGGASAGDAAMRGLVTGAGTYAQGKIGSMGATQQQQIAATTPEGANPVRAQGGPVPQGMGGQQAPAPQQQQVPAPYHGSMQQQPQPPQAAPQLSDPNAVIIDTPAQADAAFGGGQKATPYDPGVQQQPVAQQPQAALTPEQQFRETLVQELSQIPSQTLAGIVNEMASTKLGPQIVQTEFGPATEIGQGLGVLKNGTVISLDETGRFGPGTNRAEEGFDWKKSALEGLVNATDEYKLKSGRADIPEPPVGLDPKTASAIAAPYREEQIRAEDAAREMEMFNKQMDVEERGLDIQEEGQNIEAGQRGAQLITEQANAVADRQLRAAGMLEESDDRAWGRMIQEEGLGLEERRTAADESRTQSANELDRARINEISTTTEQRSQALSLIRAYRIKGVDLKDMPIDVVIRAEDPNLMQAWAAANGLTRSSSIDWLNGLNTPGEALTGESPKVVSSEQLRGTK